MSSNIERLTMLATNGDQEAANALCREGKRSGDWNAVATGLRALHAQPLSDFNLKSDPNWCPTDDNIIELLMPLVEHLVDMHSKGDIHGDLTPQGIWLSQRMPNGKRVLVDLWPPQVPLTYVGPIWRENTDYIAPERYPNDSAIRMLFKWAGRENRLPPQSTNSYPSHTREIPLTTAADVHAVLIILLDMSFHKQPVYLGPTIYLHLYEWIWRATHQNPTWRPSLFELLQALSKTTLQNAPTDLSVLAQYPIESISQFEYDFDSTALARPFSSRPTQPEAPMTTIYGLPPELFAQFAKPMPTPEPQDLWEWGRAPNNSSPQRKPIAPLPPPPSPLPKDGIMDRLLRKLFGR